MNTDDIQAYHMDELFDEDTKKFFNDLETSNLYSFASRYSDVAQDSWRRFQTTMKNKFLETNKDKYNLQKLEELFRPEKMGFVKKTYKQLINYNFPHKTNNFLIQIVYIYI